MTEQEFEKKYPQEKFTYVSKSVRKKEFLGQKEIEEFDIVSKKTGKTVISAKHTVHTTVSWNYKTELKKYLAWLTLPVLGGTNFIKDNFQYLKIPFMKRRPDILMVYGIAVGSTALVAGKIKNEFNFSEKITYGALLITLFLTMIISAKKDMQENKNRNKKPN
ncbi:hypothetical protein [Pantoea anthophila]|uniref:hypothetical protein n=1 Tax=Pantoea anthophila TaxID=470931 RepID=UPI00301C43FF